VVLAGSEVDHWGVHPLFWGLVGNGVLNLIKRDFLVKLSGGRGLDGVRWAELAVATLAKRRRAGREDGDILFETGALLASLTPGADEFPSGTAPDQIFVIHPGGVEVGTADRTAERHQKGTEYMPARPVVPTGAFTPGWEDELERICAEAMTRVIERVCEMGG
jgi:hypothetical protein